MAEKIFIESVLDNIICPICYLAMVPPSRTPMIIPECGHTICESCISSIHDCPFCHKKFTNPVKNILVLQIADSANQNNLIAPEQNPPPPANNKLVPKIQPICTFTATDKNSNVQKWYHCRTCKISGNNVFCEVCANICHKGHDVVFNEESSGYCDCQLHGKCKCVPTEEDLQCTFDLIYGTSVEQPMFQCLDCNITGDYYICQNCAMKCHHAHKLQYFPNVKGKYCHCFDQSVCKITNRQPICSFLSTGRNPILQPKYSCKTCGLTDDKCCCSACAHHCHKDHQIEFEGFSNCFCSCSDDSSVDCNCNISKCNNSSYITNCPNFNFEDRNTPKEQRMYYCYTCCIFESSGICEACAINCHINHSIEYVGMKKFCCECSQNGHCKMEMCPTLHNDRNICDRKVLSKEDISACYTCLSCDTSGKKFLCESCAFKKHTKHKIHLVGYKKFDCNPIKKRTYKPVISPA